MTSENTLTGRPGTATDRPFPASREEKRRVLLEAVVSLTDVVRAHADEAEELGTLAPAVVEAMIASGLWALKLPAELGGAEADPVTQLEVIEAMTYLDTSAGWATMIGATSIGWPGAYLPDEGVATIFAGGRIPTSAGTGGVSGTAVEVEGGHRVTGRFAFASGIPHAEWAIAGAPVTKDGDGPPELRTFVFPIGDVTLHDNWQVAGLKGTGSGDFSVDAVFVPRYMSWDRRIMAEGRPERGGAIFRLGMPGFTANEHAAFALGAARRSLDLVIEQAKSKRRGFNAALVGDRPVFQRLVAELDMRLRAARALVVELLEDAWVTVCDGRVPEPRQQMQLRAAAIHASDVSADVATQCFRYAGGGALHLDNLLQRYWRDANAAAQHGAVSDTGYETYGQFLLGMTPAAPVVAPPSAGHARE